jgi:RNA polymerase sigma-70 factor (ECF subfamily)
VKRINAHTIRAHNGTLNLAEEKNRLQTTVECDRASKPPVEQIWSRLSIRLGRFICARIADPAAAADILQDVFVKLQKRLDEFQDPAKIEGWLFLVSRNAVIDHYRTEKPMSELSESLPVQLPATEGIEIEELHAKLRQIIDRLRKEYREAFVLTTFEGFSQAELAKHLGISLSGAKSRVQRAREQLKKMLLDFCQREFSRTPGCQPCPRGLFPTLTAAKPATKQKPKVYSKKSRQ